MSKSIKIWVAMDNINCYNLPENNVLCSCDEPEYNKVTGRWIAKDVLCEIVSFKTLGRDFLKSLNLGPGHKKQIEIKDIK